MESIINLIQNDAIKQEFISSMESNMKTEITKFLKRSSL